MENPEKRSFKRWFSRMDYRFILQHVAACCLLSKGLQELLSLKYSYLMDGVMKYGIEGASKHGYYLEGSVGYFVMYNFYAPILAFISCLIITGVLMYFRAGFSGKRKANIFFASAALLLIYPIGFDHNPFMNSMLLSFGHFFERWGYFYKLLANGILLCMLGILFYVIPLPKPTAKEQASVLS